MIGVSMDECSVYWKRLMQVLYYMKTSENQNVVGEITSFLFTSYLVVICKI